MLVVTISGIYSQIINEKRGILDYNNIYFGWE
jgi:hypothetical protein